MTLDGFNVQYYFLELFGIAALIVIVGARAFAPRWWLAVLLLPGGYLSLAGGVTTVIASFAICLVQTVTAARRGVRELTALAPLAALAAAMLLDIPRLAGHNICQTHSVGQFLLACIEILSWPAAIGLTFIRPWSFLRSSPICRRGSPAWRSSRRGRRATTAAGFSSPLPAGCCYKSPRSPTRVPKLRSRHANSTCSRSDCR
jgi:hypothetical protein